MDAIKPYIMVKNANEALAFYQKVFGAEVIEHNKYEKSIGEQAGFPDDFDYENSTMHVGFRIGGHALYMADDVQNNLQDRGRVDVMYEPSTREEIEVVYKRALDEGAEVDQELQETFWGAVFARFHDPFGVTWQLNYQIPQK